MKHEKLLSKHIVNVIYTLGVMFGIYYVGRYFSGLIQNIIIIPGNIIGMGILYFLLSYGIVSFERVVDTGEFLLKHLSLFFIPFGVSVMAYFNIIKADLIGIMVVLVGSGAIAMTICLLVMDRLVKGVK